MEGARDAGELRQRGTTHGPDAISRDRPRELTRSGPVAHSAQHGGDDGHVGPNHDGIRALRCALERQVTDPSGSDGEHCLTGERDQAVAAQHGDPHDGILVTGHRDPKSGRARAELGPGDDLDRPGIGRRSGRLSTERGASEEPRVGERRVQTAAVRADVHRGALLIAGARVEEQADASTGGHRLHDRFTDGSSGTVHGHVGGDGVVAGIGEDETLLAAGVRSPAEQPEVGAAGGARRRGEPTQVVLVEAPFLGAGDRGSESTLAREPYRAFAGQGGGPSVGP